MKVKSITSVNPWADRFKRLLALDDMALGELLTRRATEPIVDLSKLSPAAAEEFLRGLLQPIYIPTQQAIDIVRRILGRAQAYAIVHYPSMDSFVRRMYEEHMEIEPCLATAITGYAGVGKSQLAHALSRLLSRMEELVLPDGTLVPLIASARLTVGNKASEMSQRAELLRQLGASRREQEQRRIPPSLIARRAFAAGCCNLVIDEIQFKSASGAGAAVTKDLLAYTHVGPPLFYLANFSLITTLMKRKHEDQERLLSDVIVMKHESPDSESLKESIRQYDSASGGLLKLDPIKAAERLDFYSGGSRRAMRELVLMAARMKWEKARSTRAVVTLTDLEVAYRSAEFAARRETSRLLMQQRATGRMADRKRPDLWCPIQSAQEVPASVKAAKDAKEALERELGEAALKSQIPLSEQAVAKQPVDQGQASSTSSATSARKKRPTTPSYEKLFAAIKTNRT